MDEKLKKKLSESLLYKLYKLENSDKSRKINRIKQEFMEQINKLKEDRSKIIQEAVSLLEERKVEELERKL